MRLPPYVSIVNVNHDITVLAALMDTVTGNIAGDGLISDIEFNRSAVLQVDVLRTGAQAERYDQRKDQRNDFLHQFPLFLSQIVCFKILVRNLPQIRVNRSISVQNVVKIPSLVRFRDL